MSSMNFTCDSCGREVFGCTFVNGMKFCARCYQETFGETDKDRKIANLEAKLAECEKSKESYRLQNEQHHLQLLQFYSRLGVEAFGADIHEKALEALMIMKEQLAEKEEEIESLKHVKVTIGTMETNQVDISSTTYIDQDKISFAVEQLEKVKGLIANHTQELWTCENDDIDVVLYEEIDKQINELKEGK